MDTVKKEKIIQDARNMFIIAIYSLQVRLRPQLLRTSYTNLLLKKTICNGKTICTVNFHIIHAAVLISFLYLFTFWLLPKMWLAKRPRCPAISCSWAATRLASMVALLISLAFCFNFSSFSCKSFSFFSNSLFLSSVSIAARQLRTSNSSSGDSCKMINPPIITFLLFVSLSFSGLYDNVIR